MSKKIIIRATITQTTANAPPSRGALDRVAGTALATCDDQPFLLKEGASTYIPLGAKHRLENPGKFPLHLIEVQCGSYLGEDDIVRFEDSYGRISG
jgi:mannose-1-phosphate guanylyltransferase/mannose-6-phosphate isomerase